MVHSDIWNTSSKSRTSVRRLLQAHGSSACFKRLLQAPASSASNASSASSASSALRFSVTNEKTQEIEQHPNSSRHKIFISEGELGTLNFFISEKHYSRNWRKITVPRYYTLTPSYCKNQKAAPNPPRFMGAFMGCEISICFETLYFQISYPPLGTKFPFGLKPSSWWRKMKEPHFWEENFLKKKVLNQEGKKIYNSCEL